VSSGGLAARRARVSRKARTVLKLQDRTANQLFRLAAASGALRKNALNKNDFALARAAQTVASSAGRLAKGMWQEYRTVAAAALRLIGGSGDQFAVRSANVGITSQSFRAKSGTKQTRSSRPKGPVNITDQSSLASAMSKLRAAQQELSRAAAKARRYS